MGVTIGVWVNDQLNRLEKIIRELAEADMSLDELERYERALVRGHARNLERLRSQFGFGDDE